MRPNIQSITNFRQKTDAMIKEVNETESPLFLTHNGKAAAVVVSPTLWQKKQDSLDMLQLLTLRENEADAGNAVDFDAGMDQIDSMIDAHGK